MASKTTTEVESCDGDTVTVNCFDVFAAGDVFALTYECDDRDGIHAVPSVQAIDSETGEPIACDLTPEQHSRLDHLASSKAAAAASDWYWETKFEIEMDRAS